MRDTDYPFKNISPDAIYQVDETRLDEMTTGIFVRGIHEDGTVDSVDIATLQAVSLLAWLRHRGGSNRLAENVVGFLLGHKHLHSDG